MSLALWDQEFVEQERGYEALTLLRISKKRTVLIGIQSLPAKHLK